MKTTTTRGIARFFAAPVIAFAILGLAVSPASAVPPTVDSGTITFASGPDWLTFTENPGLSLAPSSALGSAQNVCMHAFAPFPCPAGATLFNSPFSGWSANLAPIPGASWIWGPGVGGSTAGAELAGFWFAKDVIIHGRPTAGVVHLSADDYAEIWVNGTRAGSVGSVVDIGQAGSHFSLTQIDVTAHLKPGRNVIAVYAQNGPTWYSPYCGATCTYQQNPAGVVFGGSFIWSNGPANEAVGDRINVFLGTPTTFPAGRPFHIRHGWLFNAGATDYDAIGKHGFWLELDGVRLKEDVVLKTVIAPSEESGLPYDLTARSWVFNFPVGLTGTHTFRGHWFGPCQGLLDSGLISGPCPNPTKVVELGDGSGLPLTVTFTS